MLIINIANGWLLKNTKNFQQNQPPQLDIFPEIFLLGMRWPSGMVACSSERIRWILLLLQVFSEDHPWLGWGMEISVFHRLQSAHFFGMRCVFPIAPPSTTKTSRGKKDRPFGWWEKFYFKKKTTCHFQCHSQESSVWSGLYSYTLWRHNFAS